MKQIRLNKQTMPNIIAIDGPAASGKSSLAQRLADDLGYLYFDTGVMYRAVTWLALDSGISVDDEIKITNLAEQTEIDVKPPSVEDGRGYDVWVAGIDITWEIRHPDVDANVSQVSAYPGVRRALTEQQRRIGQRGRVVMAGRDIGTVVFPEADLKVYLDASVEERARRRYEEQQLRGGDLSYREILAAMKARDHIDSTRTVAPLRPADDALLIKTDNLSLDEVIDEVRRIIADRFDPSKK